MCPSPGERKVVKGKRMPGDLTYGQKIVFPFQDEYLQGRGIPAAGRGEGQRRLGVLLWENLLSSLR